VPALRECDGEHGARTGAALLQDGDERISAISTEATGTWHDEDGGWLPRAGDKVRWEPAKPDPETGLCVGTYVDSPRRALTGTVTGYLPPGACTVAPDDRWLASCGQPLGLPVRGLRLMVR
jgi:hypothetical protein